MTLPLSQVAVIGAGTMGAGIAQVAALAGFATMLTDVDEAVLSRAQETIGDALRDGAERGRWSARDADRALARLRTSSATDALVGAELAIEAVPERLALKRELLAGAAAAAGEDAVLATNTSSLLVSAVASGLPRPERVVGMHFFNPAPRMRLVEVVAGADTAPEVVALARAVAEAMGKRVVLARDGIGFLVNRCGRPFAGEALRLAQERIAPPEQIDRICRMAGGFRMGPFELIDLVGVDVNLEIARSFFAQSHGEPRWRPSALQAELVAAGRHGRKAGRGFYVYEDGRPHRPADPEPPRAGGGAGRAVAIGGDGPLATALRERAAAAGFAVLGAADAAGAELLVDADPRAVVEFSAAAHETPRALLLARASLAEQAVPGACGFHLLPPLGAAVELAAGPDTDARATAAAQAFFTTLGLHVEHVRDAPGLVLGRIVAQLVNEAAFAVGEGVGSPEDVDLGVTLGLNHPRGPLAWGRAIGAAHVCALLGALYAERQEERYRLAPALRTGELLG